MNIPPSRISKANHAPVNNKGDYVLYWMIAFRRTSWNYSLDRAVWRASELKKPLVILEALRTGYRWANDRIHQFILQGMAHNFQQLKDKPVFYYPYVEPKHGAGKGLLSALSKYACCIITDDFPAFFLPRMVAKAAEDMDVLLEKIDGNGLFPMRAAGKPFATAYAFRRFLQKRLPDHLVEHPSPDPFYNQQIPRLKTLSKNTLKQWPMATKTMLNDPKKTLALLPIDHAVFPADIKGGTDKGASRLAHFISENLVDYDTLRNHPDHPVTSGLSPYLHFGHISSHQVFQALMDHEHWFFDRLSSKSTGSRTGWWHMSPSAEAFLDQLITWRELGFNGCVYQPDFDRYESLPGWTKQTLTQHQADKRPYHYDPDALEAAHTHDPIWNASQTELVCKGRIQNYLRMLWGKKILEWTPSPKEALDIMVHLNNKYALDGRDPNSYSGIFWILGRYDRAWGPERKVFGKIRYMSSESARRKLRLKKYLNRYNENQDSLED